MSVLRLGWRIATGTRGQRARSAMTAVACAIGVAVILLVWGIADSQIGQTTAFKASEVGWVLTGTVGVVALPVLALVATMARLSARVRDRRLANLRLLGLSAGQTRLVAAVEVAVAAVVGALVGVLGFLALLPVVAAVDVSGVEWTVSSLVPPVFAWVCVLLGVPVVAVLVAVLPQRLSSRAVLAQSRQADVRPPGLWRVVPVLAGIGLCWTAQTSFDASGARHLWIVPVMMAGILLLGVGMLLVVPTFVRLVAVVVFRWGRGPLATLVGRRLQTQPAGATRVISSLMVGLFVVIAANGVIGAFEATPQYVSAADHVEREQRAEVTVRAKQVDRAVAELVEFDGVRAVAAYPILRATSAESAADPDPDGWEDTASVLVARCADLGELAGCRDGVVNLVGHPFMAEPSTLLVKRLRNWNGRGRAIEVTTAGATRLDQEEFERAAGVLESTPAVVVSPDLAGVAELLPETDRALAVRAGPGRDLTDRLMAAGHTVSTLPDYEYYDFVQGMRTLVWTLATVVLSIGLLTFTVAGIDRALGRRRELTALRLVGTPGWLLRLAQWLEAALPTVLGTVLAIAAGHYAGATYLLVGGDMEAPAGATGVLVLAAVLGSVVLAWITTLGTTARLDPDHIRAE